MTTLDGNSFHSIERSTVNFTRRYHLLKIWPSMYLELQVNQLRRENSHNFGLKCLKAFLIYGKV